MTKYKLLNGLAPTHPGEMLREDILPALDLPKTKIAEMLGVSRQTLYDILSEKQPVTPAMALRFGKLFGGGAEIWLRLQAAYDLAKAEREIGSELAQIKQLKLA